MSTVPSKLCTKWRCVFSVLLPSLAARVTRPGRGEDEVLIRESSRAHFPGMESSVYSSLLRSRPASLSPWEPVGSPWVGSSQRGNRNWERSDFRGHR